MPSASKPSSSNSNPERDLETWIDKIVDGKDGSVPKQVFLGGVSGWLTGFLAMKVGKIAALSLGGGIIMLQIANSQGYININWNRLNNDVENLSNKIQNDNRKKDWTEKLEKKLDKAADKAENLVKRGNKAGRRWYHKVAYGEDLKVKELQVFFCAFAAGIGVGILSGS